MVHNRAFALFIASALTSGCGSDENSSTQQKDADTTESGDALAETSPNDASGNETSVKDAVTDNKNDTSPSDAADDTSASDAPDTTDAPNQINILDFGANANDQTDDTEAVQKAVDHAESQGGGIVYVPSGVFLIDPDKSLNMRNNTGLHLADDATLKATASSKGSYAIVKVAAVSDVEIVGGHIEGERDIHDGTTGEWGMGISILGSKRVSVSNMKITNCWGDGIYVGAGELGYCEDISIDKFTMHNNRRQGISVISVKNLVIKDGVASETNGTSPQAGIDLEPNKASEYMLNVTIENVYTEKNVGYGLLMSLGQFVPAPATDRLKVTIINHTDSGSNVPRGNIDKYISQGYDITIK